MNLSLEPGQVKTFNRCAGRSFPQNMGFRSSPFGKLLAMLSSIGKQGSGPTTASFVHRVCTCLAPATPYRNGMSEVRSERGPERTLHEERQKNCKNRFGKARTRYRSQLYIGGHSQESGFRKRRGLNIGPLRIVHPAALMTCSNQLPQANVVDGEFASHFSQAFRSNEGRQSSAS